MENDNKVQSTNVQKQRNGYSNLKAEYINNLRRYDGINIVRLIGKSDFVWGFTKNKVDKDAVLVRGNNASILLSDDFINAFNFGGLVVVDTDDSDVLINLMTMIATKRMSLGGCEIEMHPNFFVVLRYDLKEGVDPNLLLKMYWL